MTEAQTAENAVRAYLESVTDPDYVNPEVENIRRQLESETDVIQIAVLKQALLDEEDGKSLEDAFVEHGKQWADDTGVSARALREMGVANDVLARAGFDVAEPSPKRPTRDVAQTPRTRVYSAEVEQAIRDHEAGDMLSVNQLVEETGASNATVTKILKENVGTMVKEPIDDPEHAGRGRAAKLYERI